MAKRPSRPVGDRQTSAQKVLERGESLLEQGKLDDAAASFERVLQRRRTHPRAALGLARVRLAQGRPREAAEILRPAGDEHPEEGQLQLVLSDLLYQLRDAEAALVAARHAAAADPAHHAAPTLEAAALLRLHRTDEAAEAVGRALALAPDDPRVVGLEGEILARRGEHETALERFQSAVTALGPQQHQLRAELLHHAGFALDALGRAPAAYRCFTAAGQLDEKLAAQQRVDPDFAVNLVSICRRGYTADVITRAPFDPAADGVQEPKARPLAFLVGFPRSGTTMTEQVLAAHPGVITSDEETILRPVRDALAGSRTDVSKLPERLASVTADEVAKLRRTYFEELERTIGTIPHDVLFVDKLPLNINHVGLLNVIFPGVRVLVALRDPRDTCLSCFMQDFPMNSGMLQFTRLDRTAAYYAQVMDLWLHVRSITTLPWMEVKYEDTVRDLPGQARRVLDHLGLPWDDAVLAFHERARERMVRTPSAAAVTEPVHTRAIGRWQPYAKVFEPLQRTLEPFVTEWGYDAG